LFGGEELFFPFELVIVGEALGVEVADFGGGADGAAGLGLVAAVAEFALRGELVDVGEGAFQALRGVPELKFAHAGRVDEDAAAGDEEKLARGGGVAATVVGLANGAGELAVFAEDGVDEGGFADAGGAEKGAGASVADYLAEFGEAVAAESAGEKNANAEAGGLGVGEKRSGGVAGVGFVQNEDGMGAAFPGEAEIALEAARVEFAVERADEQERVDVGGDDLLFGFFAGGFARELGAAGEYAMNDGAIFAGANLREEPIADGGEVGAVVGGMAKFSLELPPGFAGFGVQAVEAAGFFRDPRGSEELFFVLQNLRCKKIVPT